MVKDFWSNRPSLLSMMVRNYRAEEGKDGPERAKTSHQLSMVNREKLTLDGVTNVEYTRPHSYWRPLPGYY